MNTEALSSVALWSLHPLKSSFARLRPTAPHPDPDSEAFSRVARSLSRRGIYVVDQWILDLFVAEGVVGGMVYRDVPAGGLHDQILQKMGISSRLRRRIRTIGTILVDESKPAPMREAVAHELFHRLYLYLPAPIQHEIQASWYALSLETRRLNLGVWKGFYNEAEYGQEFWACMVGVVANAAMTGAPYDRLIRAQLEEPVVQELNRKYRIFETLIQIADEAKVQWHPDYPLWVRSLLWLKDRLMRWGSSSPDRRGLERAA